MLLGDEWSSPIAYKLVLTCGLRWGDEILLCFACAVALFHCLGSRLVRKCVTKRAYTHSLVQEYLDYLAEKQFNAAVQKTLDNLKSLAESEVRRHGQ